MLFPVHNLNKEILPNSKLKYVPSVDFYEVRNTVTDKFAFCDGASIVAMVMLQEPYFPNYVISYINLRNIVLILEYAGIGVTDCTQYEKVL